MKIIMSLRRILEWWNASTPLHVAQTVLFNYVLLKYTLRLQRHVTARGVIASIKEVHSQIARQIILLVLLLPQMKKTVSEQMGKAKLDIEAKLLPTGKNVVRHLSLPPQGKPLDWILDEMKNMDTEMGGTLEPWKQGKLSGAVYHGGEELEKVIVATTSRYYLSNPLHPELFPAVRKMEAEVVAMVLKLFHAPEGAAGAVTSGGTESIILAIKAHRDWARTVKGIREPEMIVPSTAHAAFDKGGEYLGVKLHKIPINQTTRQVDIRHVARAINPNTIMLVGSCVNFPDGNQDNIEELGKLAKKYDIGLHVDSCLGSFIVAFLEAAGLSKGDDKGRYRVSPFDFRVNGVTSISCDTHKYGFAPKGTSVIMYKTAELRSHQYYINPTWCGGVYASATISGSRPGSLIAGCWAVMNYIGTEGYIKSCQEIVTAARQIANAIADDIPELYVLGNPPASVVAFGSKDPKVDPLEVGDAMSRRGWHLNGLSEPKSVHIACTRLTVPIVEQFIADLKDSVMEAKVAPSGKGNMVAVYGLGNSSAVGPSMVGQLASTFLDCVYKA